MDQESGEVTGLEESEQPSSPDEAGRDQAQRADEG
jgi:hypothetical protein